jgi:hypothetical protein
MCIPQGLIAGQKSVSPQLWLSCNVQLMQTPRRSPSCISVARRGVASGGTATAFGDETLFGGPFRKEIVSDLLIIKTCHE